MDANNQMWQMVKEIAKMENKMDEMKKENATMEVKMDEMKKENAKMEVEIKENATMEVKMDEMKKENEYGIAKLKDEVAGKQRQMEELKATFKEAMADKQRQIDEMKAAINGMKEGMAKLKGGIVGKNAAKYRKAILYRQRVLRQNRNRIRVYRARKRAEEAANGGQPGGGIKKRGRPRKSQTN